MLAVPVSDQSECSCVEHRRSDILEHVFVCLTTHSPASALVVFHMHVLPYNGKCVQDGETCLIQALTAGHFDVVKYLCEVGGKELMTDRGNVSVVLIDMFMYPGF